MIQITLSILIFLCLLVVGLLIFWYVHLYKYKKLRIPGPKPYLLIGNIPEFGTKLEYILPTLSKMWYKYGDKFKIYLGPTVSMVITDPIYMQYFLNSSIHLNKSTMYDFYKSFINNGLVTAPADLWKINRKLINPAFHIKLLENFVQVFKVSSDRLVKKLKPVEGQPIDIYPFINQHALQIICQTSMGVNFEENPDRHNVYLKYANRTLEIAMERTFSVKRLDCIFKLSKDYTEQKSCIEVVKKYTENIINEKISQRKTRTVDQEEIDGFGVKKKLALLDLLLDCYDKGEISYEQVKNEVDTFVFAGHETISTSLAFTLHELSKHEDIQENIFQELNEILNENDELTIQKLNELKYMECVIKESMRLYTVVPFVERITETDVEIDDIVIPKGTNITLFFYQMHRDEKLFSNPDVFDPNRFFLPENSVKRHPYAFLPFSAGPRNCIGNRFSMLEMKCTLVKIIKAYRLVQPDPNFKLCVSTQTFLKSTNGYPVMLQSRS